MEKVASTGRQAGSRIGIPRGRWAAALLAPLAASPGAWAEETAAADDMAVVAQARKEPSVRVQVQTSALPRLESQDSGFQAPRVDLSLFPAKARGLGAVVGFSGFGPQQAGGLGLAAPVRPSFDLGVRWSHKQIDVTAWRRMNTADDAYSQIQMQQPVYGARVEMNVKPAKFGMLGFDRGFLGLQLESGARITIRRKNGGPMVYYRQTF